MHGNEWRGNDSKRMLEEAMDSNEIDRRVRRQVGWLVYYITMPNNFGLGTQYSVLGPGQISNEVIRTSGFQTPSAKGKIERVQVKQR